jgi:hypothetical protein
MAGVLQSAVFAYIRELVRPGLREAAACIKQIVRICDRFFDGVLTGWSPSCGVTAPTDQYSA